MSDFDFHVSVLRDTMASALSENIEHAAYVLAEFAEMCPPGSRDFAELLDMATALTNEQLVALHTFSQALAQETAQ